jgi:predicted dinucleotide-utilizing enzyme
MNTGAAPLRIGLIDFGAIGREVAAGPRAGRAGRAVLRAVPVRGLSRYASAGDGLAGALTADQGAVLTDDGEAFLAADLDVVVEVAGQAAVPLDKIREMFDELWEAEAAHLRWFAPDFEGLLPEICAP